MQVRILTFALMILALSACSSDYIFTPRKTCTGFPVLDAGVIREINEKCEIDLENKEFKNCPHLNSFIENLHTYKRQVGCVSESPQS